MTSIGTLLAFVIVCIGIMVMRHCRARTARRVGYSRHHSHLAISKR